MPVGEVIMTVKTILATKGSEVTTIEPTATPSRRHSSAAWCNGTAAMGQPHRLLCIYPPETCGDFVERRAWTVLGPMRRRPDVDESGDALVRLEAERVEHAAVIGVPFGDP